MISISSINQYKILKQIGQGGMGDVYLAEDTMNSNRLTAIKTIKSRIIEKEYSLNQFRHEYEIMSRLWHPNLARVYDFGELEGVGLYLAMEYVEGQDLTKLIQSHSEINFADTLAIMIDLLRVMEFVHSRNIVYCDIKPQNILYNSERTIKLIDFGLSDFRDSSDKIIKGTMAYMAPEILNKNGADTRSDIFSLGILFYQLLTKKVFHADSSVNSIINTYTSQNSYHAVSNPVFDSIEDMALRMIIKKMCAFDPMQRFSSCADVIVAINSTVDSENFLIETRETKEAYITGVTFTGREMELSRLELFINNPENKLMLVTGNPGTGKSRLLAEFQQKCKIKGLAFLYGSSSNDNTLEPFIPIISEILHTMPNNIDQQKKRYLAKLLPNHSALQGENIEQLDNLDPKTLKEALISSITTLLIDYATTCAKKVIVSVSWYSEIDDISMDLINEILYTIQVSGITNLKILAEYRSEHSEEGQRFFADLKEKNRLEILSISNFNQSEVSEYLNNTFGAGCLDDSLLKKIPDFYSYSSGNPLLLQELLINMVTNGVIVRDKPLWRFSGSIKNLKISTDLETIIKRRIENLNLSEQYLKGLYLMSFSRQEEISSDFYSKSFNSVININWQELLDLLARKELLVINNGVYKALNRLVIDSLQADMLQEETIFYNQLWSRAMEQKLPADYKITELADSVVFDLANYLYKSRESNLEEVPDSTVKFMFEAGRREKERYANKKAIQYFSRLLKLFDQCNDRSNKYLDLQIKAYSNLGSVYELTGKWSEAQSIYQQAVELSAINSNQESAARCKCNLANLLKKQGDIDKALNLLNDALQVAENLSNPILTADVYGSLGTIFFSKGEYDEANAYFDKQYKISETNGYIGGISASVGNIGNILMDKGNYRKALKNYRTQLDLNSKIGSKTNMLIAFCNIGNIHLNLNNYAEALKYYKKSKDVCEELGDKNGIGKILGNMGIVHKARKDYAKALSCYHKGMEIKEELGDKNGIGRILGNMGIIYMDTGDYEGALLSYNRALDIKNELGDKMGSSTVIGNIGNIHMDLGNFDLAEEHYLKALAIKNELGDKHGIIILLYNLGLIAAEKQNYLKAIEFYDQAIEIVKGMRINIYLCEFLISKTEALIESGRLDEAKISISEAIIIAKEDDSQESVIKATTLLYKIEENPEAMVLLLNSAVFSLELSGYLNYELWLITKNPEYRTKSSEFYSKLYSQTPRYEYKKRI